MSGPDVQNHHGEQWERKRDAYPESPGHIDQLGVGLIGHYVAGLEGHSTNGAVLWPISNNLRVHGTGIFRARGRSGRRFRFERHATLRAVARIWLMDVGVHDTGVAHFLLLLIQHLHRSTPAFCGSSLFQFETSSRSLGSRNGIWFPCARQMLRWRVRLHASDWIGCEPLHRKIFFEQSS